MKINMKNYQEKLASALQESFFADRLESLDAVKKDLQNELDQFNHNKDNHARSVGMGWAFGGLGVLVLGASISGIAPAVALLVLICGGAGMAAGNFMISTGYAQQKWGARYQNKHAETYNNLTRMLSEVTGHTEDMLAQFDAMPAEKQAGVQKLERLAGKYPQIAASLVETFRSTVNETRPECTQRQARRTVFVSSPSMK